MAENEYMEAVCEECGSIFHPFVGKQKYCLHCLLTRGYLEVQTHTKSVSPPLIADGFSTKYRRYNASSKQKRRIASQYFDLIQKPFDTFTLGYAILNKGKELLEQVSKGGISKGGISKESIEQYRGIFAKYEAQLKNNSEEAAKVLLDSCEPFMDSVETFEGQLPRAMSQKDKYMAEDLLKNLYTLDEEDNNK